MKNLINGLKMSLTMFTIIPFSKKWDEQAFGFLVPTLPIAGAVIGVLWYIALYLLVKFDTPVMLTAVVITLFPLFMSGFIHIDGYMDTFDAIGSRAELDKKRKILKDSNVGAFAVIGFVIYVLLGFSALYSVLLGEFNPIILIFVPILSRCVGAVSLLNIKLISDMGYGAMYRKYTKKYHTFIIIVIAIISLVLAYILGGVALIKPLIVLILGGVIGCIYSVKQLDGISGDLCGFIISISELCAICTLI